MTEEEHDRVIEEVLKRIQENDFFLKAEKSRWKQSEIEFLGLYIGPDGVCMDETKTKAITDWPVLRTVKDMRSFLGLANFYRRFMDRFSKIATPMNKLLRNNQTWEWKEVQQEAFDTLKVKFTTNLILTTPDPE